MILKKRDQHRFNSAAKIITRLKEKAEKNNNFVLLYQGDFIASNSVIVDAVNAEIFVVHETEKTVSYHMVYSEENFDESMAVTEQRIKNDFRLLKEIAW